MFNDAFKFHSLSFFNGSVYLHYVNIFTVQVDKNGNISIEHDTPENINWTGIQYDHVVAVAQYVKNSWK